MSPAQLSEPPSPRSKPVSLRTISSDTSSDESSSDSESTGGSDDVALLSDGSAIMLVDDHESLPALKLECSPAPNPQKRRLQPSNYPVITDFFVREFHEKKKRPRKHRIVPPEKLRRPKRAFEVVGASGKIHYHCTLLSFLKCHPNFDSARSTVHGPTKLQGSFQSATRAPATTRRSFCVYGCRRAGPVWMAEKKRGHYRHRGHFLPQGARTFGAPRTSTSNSTPNKASSFHTKATEIIARAHRSNRVFFKNEDG